MILTAILIFALTALGGLTMAVLYAKKGTFPHVLPVLHGIAGIAGLIVLVLGVLTAGAGRAAIFAVLGFLLAAAAGLYLYFHAFSRMKNPWTYIILHGLLAVSAFGLLLWEYFG